MENEKKIKGISIEISGNADKFNVVLDELQAKAEKLEKTLENVVNLISSLNGTTINKADEKERLDKWFKVGGD